MKIIPLSIIFVVLLPFLCPIAKASHDAPGSDRLSVGVRHRPKDCPRTAKNGDFVGIHYVGTLAGSDTRFASSHDSGQPFEFKLGAHEVLEGLERGVHGACVGERRRVVIPPHLAHGEEGAGPIPAATPLVVEFEVTHIVDTPTERNATVHEPARPAPGANPCDADSCDEPNALCQPVEALDGSGGWDMDCTECKPGYTRLHSGNWSCVSEEVLDSSHHQHRRRLNVNWKDGGAVTGVKNQGTSCSASWAFSAVGAVESHLKIFGADGRLVMLSEQQLVDCVRNTNCDNCKGGIPWYGLQWAAKNGLVTGSEYPYTSTQGTCKKAIGSYKPGGFSRLSAGSISALQTAVLKQPVSVMVDATNWALYSSGIFSNCGTDPNHAALVVGYDASQWIVKNSWGSGWGESGYIRLKIGNTCGIANNAAVPTA